MDAVIILGYLLVLLACLFLGNAVPHLTRGSAGYRHRVPWAVPGSAFSNVIWGSINLLIGAWLAWWGSTFGLFVPVALTVGLVGGFLVLTYTSRAWEKDPAARGQQTN